MKLVELEQGSEQWLAFRLGKIAGSRLGSIWSARPYTKDDIEQLLVGRGVDLIEFQKGLNLVRKMDGLKSKPYTKGELETILTDDDKEVLLSDTEKKVEFYQILADQVAVAPADEPGDQYDSAMDRGTGKEAEACDAFAAYSGKELVVVGCCVSDVDPRIINSPDRLVKPKGKSKRYTEAVEAKCLSSAKHLMAFFEREVPEEYWTQKVQYFVTNEHLQTLYWVFYDPRVAILPMFVLTIQREDLGHWPDTMLKYQLRTLKEIDGLTERLFNESSNIMLPAKAEKV